MKSLVKCGENGMMSPACLTCKHVVKGTKDSIHGFCLDETDQSGNYLCATCYENESGDDLIIVCMHCMRNILFKIYGLTPEIDWLPNIFRGL